MYVDNALTFAAVCWCCRSAYYWTMVMWPLPQMLAAQRETADVRHASFYATAEALQALSAQFLATSAPGAIALPNDTSSDRIRRIQTELNREVVLCSPALYAVLEKAGVVEDDAALLAAKAASMVHQVPMASLTADEVQVLRHAESLVRIVAPDFSLAAVDIMRFADGTLAQGMCECMPFLPRIAWCILDLAHLTAAVQRTWGVCSYPRTSCACRGCIPTSFRVPLPPGPLLLHRHTQRPPPSPVVQQHPCHPQCPSHVPPLQSVLDKTRRSGVMTPVPVPVPARRFPVTARTRHPGLVLMTAGVWCCVVARRGLASAAKWLCAVTCFSGSPAWRVRPTP